MDRREDTRIKITEDSFITDKHSKKKIGRIIDISRGGLSFYYLSSTSIPGNCPVEFNIWLQEQNLFLPDIIANTVSDIQVEYKNSLKQIQLQRRSIQFCNLSFDQTEQIHSACESYMAYKSYEQEQTRFHFHPL